MKKNLAVDSGGTKVLAVLYDEDFQIVDAYRTGSMRANTTTADMVQNNITSLISHLNLKGAHLGRVTGIVYDSLLKRMEEDGVSIEEVDVCSEADAGFAAAELFGDVMMALSGTGATMFGRYQGQNYVTGGYGSLVADEGSGYWFSRHAVSAAIRAMEGRGEPTMLVDMLSEHWGHPGDLRAAVFSIYEQEVISPAASVAACAPLVTKAAAAGDAVALRVLREAGRILGEQLIALARCFRLPMDLPVTISGGAWRKNPVLFAEFEKTLREAGMKQDIQIPAFEPIVGVIIKHFYEQRGVYAEADHERFLKMYKDYTYSIA